MAISRQAIEYAKKNPNSPLSQEVLRRAGLADVKPKKDEGNFATGFSKSVVRGAAGVAGLVQGLGQRVIAGVTPGKSYEDIRKETGMSALKPETKEGTQLQANTAPQKGEGVGYVAGEIAQFAVPASKVHKATQGLSFLPRIAVRATGDAAVAFGKTGGDVKEAGTTGAISAGVQGAFGTAGLAFKYLGKILKGTAGTISGDGTDAIEAILKNPRAAKEGLNTPVLTGLKKDARQIITYVQDFRRGSSANYAKALEKLPKESLGDDVMLGIKSRWTTNLKSLGMEIDPKSKKMVFSKTPFPQKFESKFREIAKVVDDWTDTTPAGLNRLATKIDNYKLKGETGVDKLFNKVVGTMKNGVRNYAGKKVPAIGEMNKRFGQEQNFLKELEAHLSKMSASADNPKTLKAVIGKLNTLFTKNKELAREVLEKMPGGADIVGRQAGRELAEGIPRAGASIGDLTRSVIQTVIPPKFVGNVVATTGIAQEKIAPLFKALEKLSPAERATILSFFSFLSNQSTQGNNEQ